MQWDPWIIAKINWIVKQVGKNNPCQKKKNLWSIPTLQYMLIIMNECTVDKGKN